MSTVADPLQLLIRRLETHADLTGEDQEALRALRFTLRSFEPSAYLVRDGEPPRTCGVMVSGYAFRQKLTSEGTRQIVSVHIPGEPLDFQNLFLDIADHNVQTLTRAEVAIFAREDLRQLARSHPRIGHAILVYILIEASTFREWILNIGRRDARSRLAHLLCEFAIRIDTQDLDRARGYSLPMTQEQLGDALGLTPVHVNRTLKALELEGLIKRNRRDVSFPAWEALRNVADFNERYLHLEKQTS